MAALFAFLIVLAKRVADKLADRIADAIADAIAETAVTLARMIATVTARLTAAVMKAALRSPRSRNAGAAALGRILSEQRGASAKLAFWILRRCLELAPTETVAHTS